MSSTWFRASSSSQSTPSTVSCHFCGSRYALESRKGKSVDRTGLATIRGSWSSFQCPSCESWNLRDPQTGDFVEDAQIYQDASLNPTMNGIQTRGERQAADTVFCRDCLTNQNLQVQLLAGYLPANIPDSEETRLLERLPAYQHSLANRYPLVCPNCQARVESVIEERNWKAKARTVGGWLKKSAKLAHSTADASTSPSVRHGQQVWIWALKGLAWRILYLGTICLCLNSWRSPSRIILPLTVSRAFAYEPVKVAAATLFSLSSLFISFWDPTYSKRLARGHTVRTVGRVRWLFLQGILYLLRIGSAFRLAAKFNIDPRLSYAIAAAHFLTLLLYDRIIFVAGPRRARLRQQAGTSRSTNTVQLAQSLSPSQTRPHQQRRTQAVPPASSVFGKLSLGSPPPSVPPVQRRNPYQLRDDADSVFDDEHMDMDDQPYRADSMEWEAEEEPGDIVMEDVPAPLPKIKLRPAVFDPSDGSLGAVRGLDRLFEQGVTLDDIRMDSSESANSRLNSRIGIQVGILAATIVLVVAGVAGFWYGRSVS